MVQSEKGDKGKAQKGAKDAKAGQANAADSGIDPKEKKWFEEQKLPMAGIRVIDVGTFLAGPYTASMLGEFGAEVLKVEHPIAGDPMRRFGTQTKRHDATLAWLSEARNKKSVTIDLRQPPGVELFIRLVKKADVLIENFRPGIMEEWGLGWDVLKAANPSLVMLRVSGTGRPAPTGTAPVFPISPMRLEGCHICAGSRARRRWFPERRRSAITCRASMARSE